MNILIVGMRKAEVLQCLYNHAQFDGVTFADQPFLKAMARMPGTDITLKQAEEYLESHKGYVLDYVDIGAGGSRPLKVDLSGFELDPTAYDEMHGKGMAQRAIDSLIQSMLAPVVRVAIIQDDSGDSPNPADLLSDKPKY